MIETSYPREEEVPVDCESGVDVVPRPCQWHADRRNHTRPFNTDLVDHGTSNQSHDGCSGVVEGCGQVGKVRARKTSSAEITDRIFLKLRHRSPDLSTDPPWLDRQMTGCGSALGYSVLKTDSRPEEEHLEQDTAIELWPSFRRQILLVNLRRGIFIVVLDWFDSLRVDLGRDILDVVRFTIYWNRLNHAHLQWPGDELVES